MSFVGRGERLAEKILKRLLGQVNVWPQYPLEKLISKEDFDFLDPIFQKHKFDFYMEFGSRRLAVEVNYKHKTGASRKWGNVFLPLLQKHNIEALTIDDNDCLTFFLQNSRGEHIESWDDYIDVINQLKKSGIKIR